MRPETAQEPKNRPLNAVERIRAGGPSSKPATVLHTRNQRGITGGRIWVGREREVIELARLLQWGRHSCLPLACKAKWFRFDLRSIGRQECLPHFGRSKILTTGPAPDSICGFVLLLQPINRSQCIDGMIRPVVVKRKVPIPENFFASLRRCISPMIGTRLDVTPNI